MKLITPTHREEIRAYVDAHLSPTQQVCASVDEILARFQARHDGVFKEANRFAYLSIVLVAVYIVKLAGFRLDIILLEQRVTEIPYGIFLFCSLSLIAYCISCIRTCDAHLYDLYIKSICETAWPDCGNLIYKSYIGSGVWWFNLADVIEESRGGTLFKTSYVISALLVFAITCGILISPIIAGVYFLYDWKNQIGGGYVDLQYFSVLTLSILAAALSLLVIATYKLSSWENSGEDAVAHA